MRLLTNTPIHSLTSLLFRLRRYHRLDHIINLLKEKKIILKDGEIYKSIAQKILEAPNIEDYSKHIDENIYKKKHICIKCNEKIVRYNYYCKD